MFDNIHQLTLFSQSAVDVHQAWQIIIGRSLLLAWHVNW